MSNTISSRLKFLLSIQALPAEAFDAVFPHGPKYSIAIREYMMAGIVRDIAQKVPVNEVKSQLLTVGKEMVTFSSKGLVNAWEEGDDICPDPIPWFNRYNLRGPQPDPWQFFDSFNEELLDYAAQQKQLVASVKLLATLTSEKKFSEQLKTIATLMQRNIGKSALVAENHFS